MIPALLPPGDPLLPYGLPYYCEDNTAQELADEEEDARLDFESQWRAHNGEGRA